MQRFSNKLKNYGFFQFNKESSIYSIRINKSIVPDTKS